ncbi:MAG TPA: efflux transporter outer membrane subunit [Oxalicibacterium sp.]|nr:efflux transporter outer membrane subunit [Oxalicibacterium sp.]
MRTFACLILACLTALLGACADMGDIHPQAGKIDTASLNGGSAISRAAVERDWPQGQWWRAYGDPQLDALVDSAIAGNPDLRVAEARVRQARSYAGMAEAATSPSLEAKSSLSRQLFSEHDFIPPPEAGNYAWYNRVALEGSYDLDLWGRRRDALAAAVDEVKVAAAESQMARLALENNVVRTYVQLSLQFALRDIAENTLSHRERALQVMRKRVAAGLATEADVTQLEAAVPPLHMQIDRYDEAIALLRNQLAALCGKGPADGEGLTRPTLSLANNAWLRLPSNVPADLVGHRPDVAARRWEVEASSKNIEAAKAAFYPDINLMAFIGFQAIGFDKLFSNSSAVQGVGPAISLPIFEGGRLRSNLGVRTAAYDVAVEQYNATVIHALQSVSNALVVAQSQQHQKKLNDVALATASRARELASRSFAAGMTDFLVLLNSEIALLVQQQERAQIAARMLESHAGLMVALGGGYLPETDTSSGQTPPSLTEQAGKP